MMRTADSVFRDYLDRIGKLALVLAPAQRSELIRNFEEHLREAAASGLADTPESAQIVLERLGTPDEIIEAAMEDEPHAIQDTATSKTWLSLETKAFLLLTLGSVVPVIGWAWGVALVWGSDRWKRREKWIALLVVPGGSLVAIIVAFWMASLTVMVCGSGSSGTTRGLGGEPGSPVVHDAITCSQPALVPWVGLVIAVVVLVASVAGPFFVRKNISEKSEVSTTDRPQPADP